MTVYLRVIRLFIMKNETLKKQRVAIRTTNSKGESVPRMEYAAFCTRSRKERVRTIK